MKENWQFVQLEDVCNIIGGGTPSKSNELYYQGVIPWATVRDMNDDYLQTTEFRINETAINESSTNIIPKGNVVIATRVGLGKVCLLKSDTAINQDLKGIVPKNNLIDNNFLFWWFKSISKKIVSAGTGATVQGVKLKFIKSLMIPKISLPEQKQIVAILDQVFVAIDQAQANLQKNIENTQNLFQSKLSQIFSQQGEGWEIKPLGEICKVERGSSPRPIKKYLTDNNEGVNWVKIGDVNKGDKYIRNTKQKITKEGAKKSRFVDIGDFVLSNSMSFGRPYIMEIQGYIHDGWFVLRLPEYIHPDYFWQLLASPYLKDQFDSLAAGAIVKNISGDLVKKALIPIPPFEVQKKIHQITENFKNQISDVIDKYQLKNKALENLKKSILQKAFSGELTS